MQNNPAPDAPAPPPAPPADTVSLDRARWRLAVLWFSLSGLVTLTLIVQSAAGKYSDVVQEVWSWALPTIMPTLSLILAVLGANALQPDGPGTRVRKAFYSLALVLSLAYLLLVLLTITLDPLTPYDSLELMNLSNLWLGPLQGVVASSIAVLFFTKQGGEG